MDGNKEEGMRCMGIGKAAMESGDKSRAMKFLKMAQQIYPDPQVVCMLRQLAGGDEPLEDYIDTDKPGRHTSRTNDAEEYRDDSGGGKADGFLRRMSSSYEGEANGNGNGVPSRSTPSLSGPSPEKIEAFRRIRKTKGHYEVLGLTNTSSEGEVRKTYRKLSLKVHPDKKNAPAADNSIKAVSKAFKVQTCLVIPGRGHSLFTTHLQFCQVCDPALDKARLRCARCGSKWHLSSRCAQTVRRCARCSDPNNTQKCHIVVERMRLMKTFRGRGEHEQVQSIFASLKKDGHRPTKETYTLLLSSLIANGNMQEGPSLLSQIVEDKVIPDAIFYNTLLNGYCEAGNVDESKQVIIQMKQSGCRPTTSTYNTLIKGYGLAGQPEEAMKLLQEMGQYELSKPNDRTYNMLINVWARHKNPEEARYVMSLMRVAGVGPDVVSYNTLAQIYARIGKPWEAERVIREMQNAYLRPNERTYGIVINAFIEAGKFEDALPLLERMRSEGVQPTTAVFNHLIKGYAEAMKPEGIDKVFDLMEEYGVKPDLQTFGLIMNAWCNLGYINEANKALLRMKDYDLQPDVMAYSILAKGYLRCGKPEEGEALIKVMLKEDLTPNVVTFTTVIGGYCSLAQMEDAMRVFEEMKSQGVNPNMKTFRTLIWGFYEARWPRRAEEILGLIKSSGLTPDNECLELVAESWRSIGAPEEADRVLGSKLGVDNEHGDLVSAAGYPNRPLSFLADPQRTTEALASAWSSSNENVTTIRGGQSLNLSKKFLWGDRPRFVTVDTRLLSRHLFRHGFGTEQGTSCLSTGSSYCSWKRNLTPQNRSNWHCSSSSRDQTVIALDKLTKDRSLQVDHSIEIRRIGPFSLVGMIVQKSTFLYLDRTNPCIFSTRALCHL